MKFFQKIWKYYKKANINIEIKIKEVYFNFPIFLDLIQEILNLIYYKARSWYWAYISLEIALNRKAKIKCQRQKTWLMLYI